MHGWKAHGYSHLAWKTLVQWWNVEHEILMAVVERIPEERMTTLCTVGNDAPVTLRYLDRGLHSPPVPPFRANQCSPFGELDQNPS